MVCWWLCNHLRLHAPHYSICKGISYRRLYYFVCFYLYHWKLRLMRGYTLKPNIEALGLPLPKLKKTQFSRHQHCSWNCIIVILIFIIFIISPLAHYPAFISMAQNNSGVQIAVNTTKIYENMQNTSNYSKTTHILQIAFKLLQHIFFKKIIEFNLQTLF